MADGSTSDISTQSTHIIDDGLLQEPRTVLETEFTVEKGDTKLKISSKISVSKSQDLFIATKSVEPFIDSVNKFLSETKK